MKIVINLFIFLWVKKNTTNAVLVLINQSICVYNFTLVNKINKLSRWSHENQKPIKTYDSMYKNNVQRIQNYLFLSRKL